MLVTVFASTLVWLAVTFATKAESDETLERFYRRVRPGGAGWARVSKRLGLGVESIPGGALSIVNWLLGVVLVYAALFGIGQIVLGNRAAGLCLLLVAALSFAAIFRNLSRPAQSAEIVES